MKLSVIFGVAQMSLGIFLKAANARFFKKDLDFYFEFIPQITLLWAIFGYMITLIIVKWLTDYSYDTHIAPSIISYMIEMFLNFGSISGDAIIHSRGLNETLHIFLLFIAFICIPSMLVIKPYILNKQHNSSKHGSEIEMADMMPSSSNKYQKFEEDDVQIGGGRFEENKGEEDINDMKRFGGQADLAYNDDIKDRLYGSVGDMVEKGEHNMGEIAIHQLIETIEFVLGTISNTASYLRLWALSLAHSQLASVFFEKTLGPGLEMKSGFMLSMSFPIFATATFGVLMCMDSMECFLHTLRLHWVEFQNKFFRGTGYKFNGFCIATDLGINDI